MTLANHSGANSLGTAVNAIKEMLSEPKKPTESKAPEEAAETSEKVQETPEGDTEKPSRRVKAKLGDKDVEFDVVSEDIDLELVPKGLMMEADYRKKTSAVAEERKKIEAKQAELDSKLDEARDLLFMEAKELDSDEMKQLREYDPDQYYKKREALEKKVEKFKKFQETRQSELEAKRQELIKAEAEKYTQLIPDWLDEGKKAEDHKRMAKSLKDVGFSDEDIAGLYDSRLMAIVRKAALYDDLAAKTLDNKRVTNAPVTIKPNSTAKPSVNKVDTAMNRLKQTGHLSDAQAAIRAMISGE